MLHHPSGSARGQASDIQNEARELLRIRGYVNKMLAQATGKSIERVRHKCILCSLLKLFIAMLCQAHYTILLAGPA